jgi:hypothetical protein
MKSASAILEVSIRIHLVLATAICLAAQIQNSKPPNEEARREQVMQWSVKADADACQGLERALTVPSLTSGSAPPRRYTGVVTAALVRAALRRPSASRRDGPRERRGDPLVKTRVQRTSRALLDAAFPKGSAVRA